MGHVLQDHVYHSGLCNESVVVSRSVFHDVRSLFDRIGDSLDAVHSGDYLFRSLERTIVLVLER